MRTDGNLFPEREEEEPLVNYLERIREVTDVPVPVHSAASLQEAEELLLAAVARHNTCPVTMEPITHDSHSAVTQCNHVFKTQALLYWLQMNRTCPVCRAHCDVSSVRVGLKLKVGDGSHPFNKEV